MPELVGQILAPFITHSSPSSLARVDVLPLHLESRLLPLGQYLLSECLGGRYETIGDDFEGSSITVPVGAEEVPGLMEALSE